MDPLSKDKIASENAGKFKPGHPHRFQKGHPYFGVAKGTPNRTEKCGKNVRPATEMYEEIMANPRKRKAIQDQQFKTMASKGMAGVLERREMAERLEGKVVHPVELSGGVSDLSDAELDARLAKLLGITQSESTDSTENGSETGTADLASRASET